MTQAYSATLLEKVKMKMINSIIPRSCEQMAELEDGSVALTVTSPPYWNAIDYDRYVADKTQPYRTRAYNLGFSDYDEYLGWLERIFREVFRVTKPGGFLCVIIGTVLLDGEIFPVPFDLVSRLSRGDWLFHQDIIWHKCTAGVKRAGVSIQKPFPGYYYPNIMNEYILVFRKHGSKIYLGRTEAERSSSGFSVNRLFKMDIANNIWHIAPVPPGYIDHPAPFPEEIPFRLIQLYSYQGDIVLDPFAGSGQTTKVARQLGRRFIGYEIVHEYAQMANDRLSEPLSLRPEQLVVVFSKVSLSDPGMKDDPPG
jgi:modification methylase